MYRLIVGAASFVAALGLYLMLARAARRRGGNAFDVEDDRDERGD
jgi:hypothetical protein